MNPQAKRILNRPKNVRLKNSFLLFNGLTCCLILTQTLAGTSADAIVEPRSLRLEAPQAPYSDAKSFESETYEEPTGTLVLPQAMALALILNPELAAFSHEIRAREAATLQANLIPNPVFSANASNFGNHKFLGYDGESVSLQLSQLIELGGKRTARTEAAALAQELASWDYRSKRIDVLAQVSRDFIEVLAAQKRLLLNQQLLDLSDQVQAAASALVKGGSVAPVEETKAKVARASSRIELMRARRELNAARQRLAAHWGSTAPRFQIVQGDLETIQAPSSLQALFQRLEQNPDLARWATEIGQRQALLAVEKAKAIPDLTVTLGANHYFNGGDDNMLAGFSMPLPLFDRNQGGIHAAQQRLSKARDERRSTEVRLATTLNTIYQHMDAAYNEVTTLSRQVLPAAHSAFDAARRGYRLGKFDILDVLDAQRTLFGVKTQYLQALKDYHLNVIHIERLIGGALQAPEAMSE